MIQKGERNHGWVVHTETARGEETRKAWEHVYYWICRPGEGIRHSVKRNCDGNVALAGSARSRCQDSGGNIGADEWESHHRCGPAGMSEQFSVNIGLRQGSVLSPLLFIVVMELISRKVSMTDTSRKLLYADDLAIVAEDKEELNESLAEWKDAFKQHGLRVNLEKTEVLSIGAHRYMACRFHIYSLNCRYLQLICRYLQMNCRYLQIGLFVDISN